MRKITKKQIIPGALCLAALLACVILLLPRESTLEGWVDQEILPASQQRRIQQEIARIAESCRELYSAAEKQAPEYSGGDTRLYRKDIDAIENRIMELGYPTLDSDETYPSHLANPEGLYAFWEAVSEGKDARQTVIRVWEHGGFSHMSFFREDGTDFFVSAQIAWDQNGEPYVRECQTLPVYDMELADWGIFYYRLYPADDPHYVDYNQIRMEPVDRELYDLNRKYILPIGFQLVNLFLCDWREGDWGELSFNDVFEYLYEINTGEPLQWEQFSFRYEPKRAMIPARLFEDTVLPYFQISLDAFRERCQYDEETDSYPWRPVYGDDLTAWEWPKREPQVVAYEQNSDGTITLTVQVYSPEVKTDRLFIHEVTVRPLEDGGFQYAANKVTYVSEFGLPPAMPRFELDSKV